jgi:hypothetical protein
MAEVVITEHPNAVEQEVALFCPGCLYDLRGITADTCPECGVELDREKLATSAIPWVHRKGLGLGALIKTAWLATFKTQLFCLEVARPVSLSDARKFRRQIVALLTVVVLLTVAVFLLVLEDVRDPMEQLWSSRPTLMVLLAVSPVIPVWLFILAFTGVHTYWFHPKGLSVLQQNRAVAVSHYACAPLVGFVPAMLTFGFAMLLGLIAEDLEIDAIGYLAVAVALFSFTLLVVSLAAYLFVCAHMARFAAHRSGLAQLTLWLGLPTLWVIFAGLIFGVLPLVALYIYLVVTSF